MLENTVRWKIKHRAVGLGPTDTYNFPVVVEKPFTPTYKEAQELVELAKRQNRLLTVYQSK